LWVARRVELGHPLGVAGPLPEQAEPVAVAGGAQRPRMLVLEIGTEEMPPAEARAAREQVRRELTGQLAATRLGHGEVRVYATPRRLIAVVGGVAAREDDHTHTVKGPRTTAPAQAREGFARAQGVPVESLETVDGQMVVRRHVPGGAAPGVLAGVLAKVVAGLRSARNMRWNDPRLTFTRPVRWLVALWGDDVVPVAVGALRSGRETRILRTAVTPVLRIASAETFMETISVHGIVADPDDRRELIVSGAQELVYDEGNVDVAAESELIDQITYLVEQPTPLLGRFSERHLDLPDAVLTTVMRKHQRYLPVRGDGGALLPMFVTVANGPVDADLVRAGNEAVLRARYEDAAFFYRADRATPLAAMRERLRRLTFTDKLGSMADRAARIDGLTAVLASAAGVSEADDSTADRAGELVKFDLGAQLVTEMTSLAGVMARDYAIHAGESPAVAQALYEAELPRHAGDDLPGSVPGALLSMADRLDLITGLAATVGLPTGSSDPFAVRRAVLGLIAVHRAHPDLSALDLVDALAWAGARQPVDVGPAVLADVREFLTRRLEQVLTEEGHPVDRVRAVLPHAGRPSVADRLLAQLGRLAAEPDFRKLAEAIQRARRIVPDGTPAGYDPARLTEPVEQALHSTVTAVRDTLDGTTDLGRFTAVAAPLTGPVERFFAEVFVMADDAEVRAARLGLLAAVRDLGESLLDWQQLRL
ncbi:glycine--tRNA ligase subunit beta, partial [Couchioplanes caeruleus]